MLQQQANTSILRRLLSRYVLVLLILAVAVVACSSSTPAGPEIRVEDVWSRPAKAMGQMGGGTSQEDKPGGTGAVFMKLVNIGRKADRLVGAQTEVAEVVEIHETRMEGDVMKMQYLPNGLEIPAEGEVVLKPGGYHIMLIGLKRDLNEGDQVALVLAFEKSGAMEVEAEVRQP